MDVRTLAAAHLHDVHEGPAWHGPSLKEALAGVEAALAVRRPGNGGHCIWELAGHVAVWEEVCARWLSGEAVEELTPAENFPAAGDGESAWDALRARCDRAARSLEETIRRFPPSQLEAIVPARDYTFAALIRNIPFHSVYHTGQIMILKKVLNGS